MTAQLPTEASSSWTRVLRLAAGLSLLGAAVIHVTQIGIHGEEWAAAGGFFIVLAVGQGLLGLVLLARDARPLSWAAVTLSLIAIAVWVTSRTTGLPFGPEAGIAEPMERSDSLATLFEVATILTLVLLVRSRPKSGGSVSLRGPGYVAVATIFVSVAALTTYAIQPVNGCGHHGVETEKLAQQDPHRERSPGKRPRHHDKGHDDHKRSRDQGTHKAGTPSVAHAPEKAGDC